MNPVPDAAPEQFGPYDVYERLGLGGMATVHRAKKRGPAGFEQTVALKRMLSHLAEDGHFVESFIREAKVASMLVHPNIAQVYDFGRYGGIYYIAMELVSGFDVRKLLRFANKSNESVPLPVVLSIIGELADALDYAHSFVDEGGIPLRIIHRDISPSNMIVAHTGHLKVIDFGIAKAHSRQLHTESGQVKGKLGYMSPEAALGMSLGTAADVFSMGVVAWELVTASPLFSARTDFETMRRIRDADITPPSQFNTGCPPELDAIILRALDRDPERRLQTAREFRTALDSIAARSSVQTSARSVAEWLVRYTQPDDLWARSSTRLQHPPEQPTSVLRPKRASKPGTPLKRTSEDIQLATEIWGDDANTAAPPPMGPDFSHAVHDALPLPAPMGTPALPPIQQLLVPPSPQSIPDLRRSSSRAPFVIVGVLALIAAGLGGYLLVQRASNAPPAAAPDFATPGTLALEIEPAGAIIAIAGKEVGRTSPFETELAAGTHEIAITKDGYKPWTRSVAIDGEREAIKVVLEPATAKVVIDSKPSGLPITIDGKRTGKTTPATIDAPVGAHRIEVTYPSGEAWTQEFTATADGNHAFTAELAAKPPEVVEVAAVPEKQKLLREKTARGDRVAIAKVKEPKEPRAAKPPKGPEREAEPEPEPEDDPPGPVETKPVVTPPPPPPAPKDIKPARTPVVAATAVSKLSGEIPALKGTGTDSNGDVTVKMCIDDQGKVTSTKVIKSTTDVPSELQSALSTWRYKPYLNKDKQPSPACFVLSLRLVFKR